MSDTAYFSEKKSVNFFNPTRIKNHEDLVGSASHPQEVLTFALLRSFESYFRECLLRIFSMSATQDLQNFSQISL